MEGEAGRGRERQGEAQQGALSFIHTAAITYNPANPAGA